MIEREARAIHTLDPLPRSMTILCGLDPFQSSRERKVRASIAAATAVPSALPNVLWTS